MKRMSLCFVALLLAACGSDKKPFVIDGGSDSDSVDSGSSNNVLQCPQACAANQKCSVIVQNNTLIPRCVAVSSTAMPATSICTTDSQCVDGTWCDRPAFGNRCVSFCTDQTDTSCDSTQSPGSVCIGQAVGVFACSTVCDLFHPRTPDDTSVQFPCNTGEDCKFVGYENGACLSIPSPPVAQGHPCMYINDCGNGMACIDVNAQTDAGSANPVCVHLCRVQQDGAPDGGAQACTSGTCMLFTTNGGGNFPDGLGYCN